MMKHYLKELKERAWEIFFGMLFITISYLLVYAAYGFSTEHNSLYFVLGMLILWNSGYALGRREGRRDVKPEPGTKHYEG